jgi:hypothetical protein
MLVLFRAHERMARREVGRAMLAFRACQWKQMTFTMPATSQINISPHGLAHVLERHTVGGALTAGKSVFFAGENVARLIRSASMAQSVQQASGYFERIIDAGRTIGIDRATGQPTSTYTVITDAADNLITAFPGRP